MNKVTFQNIPIVNFRIQFSNDVSIYSITLIQLSLSVFVEINKHEITVAKSMVNRNFFFINFILYYVFSCLI